MRKILKITTILSVMLIVVCTALLITQTKTSYALEYCTMYVDQIGNPISGIEYEITENGMKNSYITGKDGIMEYPNPFFAELKIKQIPATYKKYSEKLPDDVIVDNPNNCSVEVLTKTTDFEIKKVDNNNLPLKNVAFSIYDENVIVYNWGKTQIIPCGLDKNNCGDNEAVFYYEQQVRSDSGNRAFLIYAKSYSEGEYDFFIPITDVDIYDMTFIMKEYNVDGQQVLATLFGDNMVEGTIIPDVTPSEIIEKLVKINTKDVNFYSNLTDGILKINTSFGIEKFSISRLFLGNYKTDDNGLIVLKDFDYYRPIIIEETKALDGYTVEQTEYTANISDGSITIVNNKIEEPTPEEPTPENPTPEEPTPEEKTQDKKTETTGNKEEQKTTDVKTKQVADNKDQTVQTGVSTNIEKYILAVGIVMFITSIVVSINIHLKKSR